MPASMCSNAQGCASPASDCALVPPPLDPLPPSPLSSSAPENLGFGNMFQSWEKNFRRLRRMPFTVYVLLHVCSIYLVFQNTMPQRSL